MMARAWNEDRSKSVPYFTERLIQLKSNLSYKIAKCQSFAIDDIHRLTRVLDEIHFHP